MTHEELMDLAIQAAARSVEQGGGPFGAVVADVQGNPVAISANSVTTTLDPTAHAEVNAIRMACRILGQFSLEGHVIYTSCEPCPMCLAAIWWARLDRIYYACTKEDAADAGFDDSVFYRELSLPPQERTVLATRLMRAQALPVFQTWREKEDRTDY